MYRITKFPKKVQRGAEGKSSEKKELSDKPIFQYFRKYQVKFTEESLKKQFVKKRDIASLNFTEYTFYGKGLRRHSLAIRSTKKLSKLNITTILNTQVQNHDFTRFCEAIKKQSYLRHIHFRLPNLIDEYQLKALSKSLRRVQDFQSLSLLLPPAMMEGDGMENLSITLKMIYTLRHLNLTSPHIVTVINRFRTLGIACKRLYRLQSLNLRFKWAMMSGLGGFGSGLKGGRNIIQNIRIENIDSQYSGDQSLQDLSDDLKNFGSIQNVCIESFQLRDISDEGLEKFCETFKELCFLKNFNLSLIHCNKITKKGLRTFSDNLQFFYYLNSFNFELNSCSIREEGVAILSQGLKEHVALKHINLRFLNCCEISDSGLEELGQMLRSMNQLESFSLQNSRKSAVTNLGLQALTYGLTGLASLQKLKLDFEQFVKIDDKGMDYLIQGFEKLVSLRELHIGFIGIPGITNEILGGLVESLEKIGSLTDLRLRIVVCQRINSDGVELLQAILKNIQIEKGLKYELAYGSTYESVKSY